MVKGVSLISKQSYESEFVRDFGDSFAVRAARIGGTETVIYRMGIEATGCFEALRDPNMFEEYYLVSGRIVLEPAGEEPRTMSAGDILVLEGCQEDVLFHVEEPATFVFFSNNCVFEDDIETTRSIESILSCIQEEDGLTLKHCERVRKLALAMVPGTKYPSSGIASLQHAARFHDVGKANIPLEILVKPAKLTAAEYEIVKRHPVWSEELARPVLGDKVAALVRQHHERMDGEGYPDGLTGDQIELGARIISVANAYDAITSDEPYDAARTPEQAVAELRANAGTQFDPVCVQALIDVLVANGTIQA